MANWTAFDLKAHQLREVLRGSKSADLKSEISDGDKATKEADLHDQIYDECRLRGWVVFHGSMAARTHRTEGEPDFIILADHGCVFLVECKRRDGKLSSAQLSIQVQAARNGHVVHVVRGFQEFLQIVS